MRTASSIYDALVTALAAVAGLLLVLATLSVVVDVCARYFLNQSFAWVFELTEYVLLYVPCLGMAWLARERGHISIDIVTSKLSHATRARLFAATSLIVAAICAFISYWGFVVTWDFYARGIVSENVLSIPRWIILVCIPIGFGLTAIEFIRLAVYRGEGLPAADEAALDHFHGGA